MKRLQAAIRRLLLLAAAVAPLAVFVAEVQAAKEHDLPIHSEPVRQAVSSENLRAASLATDDPDVLLGLTYLVRPGDPLRQELSQRLIGVKPESAPIASVLAVMMDGADPPSVAALIKRDPDNALGHYLHANLLYGSGNEAGAIDAFRRAAACRELRLYEPVTSTALLEALDALKLQGRERLYALSWMATRVSNSGVDQIQPLHTSLTELARQGDVPRREEMSDLLLILAGHLYRTNFNNRTYGERALQAAFRLKAEVAAAEKSPRMYGYAAVTQALVSTMMSWPEIADQQNLQSVVPFVPDRIYAAFAVIDPEASKRLEEKLDLSPEARAAYEQARQRQVDAAKALIEAAMANPDEIVGAYLKGVIEREDEAKQPWVSQYTHVERAMSRWPALFKAAIRNEEAMNAVYAVRRSDPRQQNIGRMMRVGGKLISYAFKHENQLPESLDVLVEQKLLDPAEAKSLITGRPYVYVAAGQKLPEKQSERFKFILLYDEHSTDGNQQAVLAIPAGFELPAEELKERLKAQGK